MIVTRKQQRFESQRMITTNSNIVDFWGDFDYFGKYIQIRQSDSKKLLSDWNMIGKDIAVVSEKFANKEFKNKQ